MNRALFLDRDGVLNDLVFYASSDEWESPRVVGDLRMIEGVAEPLRSLSEKGWLLVIVTNQPSFGKGKTSREALLAVNAEVERRLAEAGAPVAASYLCLHHPEASVDEVRVACDCRKPGTRSLLDAARQLEIDLSASWMVGDQDSDILCGRAAGCRTALIEHPGSSAKRGAAEPDVRCGSLEELAELLLGE